MSALNLILNNEPVGGSRSDEIRAANNSSSSSTATSANHSIDAILAKAAPPPQTSHYRPSAAAAAAAAAAASMQPPPVLVHHHHHHPGLRLNLPDSHGEFLSRLGEKGGEEVQLTMFLTGLNRSRSQLEASLE